MDSTPERWGNLDKAVKQLNAEAPAGVAYKVLFLGKWGTGILNGLRSLYGVRRIILENSGRVGMSSLSECRLWSGNTQSDHTAEHTRREARTRLAQLRREQIRDRRESTTSNLHRIPPSLVPMRCITRIETKHHGWSDSGVFGLLADPTRSRGKTSGPTSMGTGRSRGVLIPS